MAARMETRHSGIHKRGSRYVAVLENQGPVLSRRAARSQRRGRRRAAQAVNGVRPPASPPSAGRTWAVHAWA
jgi:hypothetical protein